MTIFYDYFLCISECHGQYQANAKCTRVIWAHYRIVMTDFFKLGSVTVLLYHRSVVTQFGQYKAIRGYRRVFRLPYRFVMTDRFQYRCSFYNFFLRRLLPSVFCYWSIQSDIIIPKSLQWPFSLCNDLFFYSKEHFEFIVLPFLSVSTKRCLVSCLLLRCLFAWY